MNVWLLSILIVFFFVNVAYLLSRILKRNDFMDVLWGLGFLVLTYKLVPSFGHFNPDKVLLFFFIFLWSIRLSCHILLKNWGKSEDFRYKDWRNEWGKTEWWRSYLQVYLLQGVFMFIISLPIIAFMGTNDYYPELQPWSFDFLNLSPSIMYSIGIGVICIGLLIETLADFQKSRFKKKKPEGLMKTGLWKYSRHPNYFGEAFFWWGIALYCSVEVSIFYGLISAATITILLRYVSGVPMLEKAKEGNLEFEKYKKETPVFIPFLRP